MFRGFESLFLRGDGATHRRCVLPLFLIGRVVKRGALLVLKFFLSKLSLPISKGKETFPCSNGCMNYFRSLRLCRIQVGVAALPFCVAGYFPKYFVLF